MKKIVSLLSLSFLFGCSTSNKIAALKPMPSENVPMVYKTTTSFVDMPMEITLKEIENQLNKSLSGLIYEDNNLEDDKSEMKIWKTGTIKLIEKTSVSTCGLIPKPFSS